MAGRSPLDADAALAIGAACAEKREQGTPWKLLEREFDRDRVTLWRYTQTASPTGDETHSVRDETPMA